jgi:putative transposase
MAKDSRQDKQKQERYWTGAHTTHKLRYHLVFVPKYRKRVLRGEVAARLGALLRQACEVNKWQAEELAIQPDHVHLLVQVQPKYSVSGIVNTLKGGTSRVLRLEFPDLEEHLWGDSFWADGYFAASVGVVEGSVVTEYVRAQRR